MRQFWLPRAVSILSKRCDRDASFKPPCESQIQFGFRKKTSHTNRESFFQILSKFSPSGGCFCGPGQHAPAVFHIRSRQSIGVLSSNLKVDLTGLPSARRHNISRLPRSLLCPRGGTQLTTVAPLHGAANFAAPARLLSASPSQPSDWQHVVLATQSFRRHLCCLSRNTRVGTTPHSERVQTALPDRADTTWADLLEPSLQTPPGITPAIY